MKAIRRSGDGVDKPSHSPDCYWVGPGAGAQPAPIHSSFQVPGPPAPEFDWAAATPHHTWVLVAVVAAVIGALAAGIAAITNHDSTSPSTVGVVRQVVLPNT